MSLENPTLSIGLAVYNGEKNLREAIESILCQTYQDFELILSDNASTDGTAEICKEYLAKDPRIKYHRNEQNIGGANNENLTFKLSKGKYFRWAAHDDICAPTLFEKCIAVLEENPEIVLCHSKIIEIVEGIERNPQTDMQLGEKPKPYQRFVELSNRNHSCEAIYGIIRSEVFRKTRLQLNYTDSDRTLLCELSLYGPFRQIPERLFYKRFHSKNLFLDWRTRMAWFSPTFEGKIVLPNWIQFFDYLNTIGRVKLSFSNRLRCYFYILGPWLWKNFRFMIKDILFAVNMLIHTSAWRKDLYRKTNNWS
jgi:glycosyltransferase involved in cell wall biosynthesis